ncbi:MAG: 30S ribosomal protein S2 [Nanoarchaeota archaeon]
MAKEKKSKDESVLVEAEKAIKKVAKKAIKEGEEIVKEVVEAVENNIPNTKESNEKKEKLSKLLAKAKKLESAVEEDKKVDLKKQVKSEETEKENTLVTMEDYLKSSIHLGTRVITPDMRKYVYRRRADGLAVFNTALLDDKIRDGAAYLSKFDPEKIIIVCKRDAGWRAVKKFSEVTGIKAFTKKYPAGILTNTNLENFTETDLIFICDPWLDKNALEDANRVRVPVLSICDTNNFTAGINQVIPGNNKSAKSLGMIIYLLTKLYVESKKLDVTVPPIQEFIEGWDNLLPPK